MNAILSSSVMTFVLQFIFKKQLADLAVEYADKLIEELKKDKKHDKIHKISCKETSESSVQR